MEAPELTLNRALLSDQVYVLIKRRILGGEFSPGERLVEYEIAKQLKVSQAPVRDGLRKLAHDGLVLQIPRRGTFVAQLSEQTAKDAYKVRAALEPLAVNELLGRVQPSLISALKSRVDSMIAAAQSDDLTAVLEHDIAFHRLVWEHSGNELLRKIWPMIENVWPMLEASLRHSKPGPNRLYFANLTEVAKTHEPLVTALENGDANCADLFHEHVIHVWSGIENQHQSP